MKKMPLVVAAVLLAAALITLLFIRPFGTGEHPPAAPPAEGVEYYTCPMHPSVISSRPGRCPVCGMTLVKKISGAPASAAEAPPGGAAVVVSAGQRVQANITTVAVKRAPFVTSVSAAGVVTFAEPGRAIVASRARGRVEHLVVNRTGVVVRKGDPLVSFYSPDIVSAEEEYLIALSGAADSARSLLVGLSRRRLVERFGLTEPAIDRLERGHDTQSPVMYASPVSGTVIRKEVVEGEYVGEGTTLFEIADLSRVWVIASVPEENIPAVRKGDEAEITVDAYPGVLLHGRVGLIEPVLDAGTRSLRVRAEIANGGGSLRPNMYVRVRLSTAPREALLIPTAALLFTGIRPRVWVESSPGRFEPREVRVGQTSGGVTEILDGVAEGEMVAATGGFLIDSESQLQPPARKERP
ncbi:MAG TPA: efflux RND transporter periplasmic adaptor subunit [Bacteroidota bacterium]|nr:efflux RND transporter periplasmic adaptor subunit [Bacteroidota bacterium]